VRCAVPFDHFAHGIGDDFVHVYDDAFHAIILILPLRI
jgi:hypothetical protein